MNDSGLVTVACRRTVGETMDRFSAAVQAAGLRVFARIDHAANAAEAGLQLRPTELLIFGNPRGGTPLMQDRQTAGIDLPVKALAWQDEDAKVWLTYNAAQWIGHRHGLGADSRSTLDAIADGVANMARHAAGAM
ncbi:MAG: DUF302 domain-containing protein [Nocardia sp.]|nr:DUF302 domain-containing protein [Nocardia sp.]